MRKLVSAYIFLFLMNSAFGQFDLLEALKAKEIETKQPVEEVEVEPETTIDFGLVNPEDESKVVKSEGVQEPSIKPPIEDDIEKTPEKEGNAVKAQEAIESAKSLAVTSPAFEKSDDLKADYEVTPEEIAPPSSDNISSELYKIPYFGAYHDSVASGKPMIVYLVRTDDPNIIRYVNGMVGEFKYLGYHPLANVAVMDETNPNAAALGRSNAPLEMIVWSRSTGS